MKQCPTCRQTYSDRALNFCRLDGTALQELDSVPTRILEPSTQRTNDLTPNKHTAFVKAPSATGKLTPTTNYARSGDINIAYQVLGSGDVDLIYVPGWVSHLEYGWEEPAVANFYNKLASFSRLILFDKRGTGLSDQSTNLPTLEDRMDDVRAVMQAVESERAVLFGMSEGGNMSILFAATYPERTIALITFGVFAKRIYHPDYPWAPTTEQRQKFYDAIENSWGGPIGIEDLAPSKINDQRFRDWWASYQRRSATPNAALALAKMNTSIDVRDLLPAIRVPTLVIHRTGDRDSHVEEGRYLAAHIPGAKFVELPGDDHLLYVGDQDAVLREIETFIKTGDKSKEIVDKVLATVLYVEAPGITKTNDATFEILASRETEWFRGRLSHSTHEVFCATFDGPIRAIKCARAIREAASTIGIETKAGLHTGLCEMKADLASGPEVDISKRVADNAEIGEVLLTNTVMDLVSGSGFHFSSRDDCNIEGLPKDCSLFAVL